MHNESLLTAMLDEYSQKDENSKPKQKYKRSKYEIITQTLI
jgi:hypothetical protein